jgi:hypothetical protein
VYMRTRVLYPSGPFVLVGVNMEFHGGVLAEVTFGGVDFNGPWSEADERSEAWLNRGQDSEQGACNCWNVLIILIRMVNTM